MKHHRKCGAAALIAVNLLAQTAAFAKDPRSTDDYQLLTNDCELKLQAKKGGRVIVDGPYRNFSQFSEKSDTSGWSLTFDFQCLKQNAGEYCPGDWMNGLKNEDPSTLKRIGVRRYDHQHPHYYSMAYAVGRNTMDPPRDRTLYFCLGDESRTVIGWVPIGDDKHQFPTQALKIINTLQIRPIVNAQTSLKRLHREYENEKTPIDMVDLFCDSRSNHTNSGKCGATAPSSKLPTTNR